MVSLFLFAALSIPFAVILWRSPLIRHLSTRHAFGRPVEAVLVIAGSLLGTAIITGSLMVGDTINRSIRAAAYDQLGPVDEIVAVPLPDGPTVAERLHGFSAPSVDGLLSMTSTAAAVVHPGRGARHAAARAAPRGRLRRRATVRRRPRSHRASPGERRRRGPRR